MGGDGMNGLAVAILVAMILTVAAGFGLFFLGGWLLGGWFGLARGPRWLLGLGAGALGVGVGFLAVTATFYESTWNPPPTLALAVAPGFARKWVVLLEDPSSPRELRWTGRDAPFSGRTAAVEVPPSGVVRVRSFDWLAGRGDARVVWSDGARQSGYGGGPAPDGLRASSYIAVNRGDPLETQADAPPFHDPAAFARFVAAREGGG